jgi:hypothetical protein
VTETITPGTETVREEKQTDLTTPSEHASEVVMPPVPGGVGDPNPRPTHEGVKRVLIFLNEVAGGRKLLQASRQLSSAGADYFAVVAPQNEPSVGQIIDEAGVRAAAQSRVDVTLSVLDEFGIDAVGAVLDPDPMLALDDAVRATTPDLVLLSCLYEARYGLTRKDLVEWAKDTLEVPVEHIPVRVHDDAVSWDTVHTLVVATQTVHSPDLIARLKQRAAEKTHRYTFICPRSGNVTREQVCRDLAATLAEMYRAEIDATGQPMAPDPLSAVLNAVEHYSLDEILVATLRGEESQWMKDGLVEKLKVKTALPVEHVEAGVAPRAPAGAVS